MGSFGLFHWLIVAVILLIFFGPSKLPDLGKSLGLAIKGFKEGLNTEDAEATEIVDAKPKQALPASAAASQSTAALAEHASEAQKETEKKNV